MKIGVIGLGTVGYGVIEILTNEKTRLEKEMKQEIVVKYGCGLEEVDLPKGIIYTKDYHDVINDEEIDVVVELIGGTTIAKNIILEALNNKKHVVTANKALLAHYGKEIFQTAKANDVHIFYEASVGGGIPVLASQKESLIANNTKEIVGILNGTTNFILTLMENENLDEFMPDEIMEPMTTEGTKSNSLDLFEQVNSMMDELNQDVFGNSGQGTTRGGNNISYNKKMMSMLTSGYYCGMHFYLSCTDVLALNRLGQKDLSVFRSRILFRTLARDVYKIMDTTINIEGLGDNMAVYSDGINSPEIFRPYNLECDER